MASDVLMGRHQKSLRISEALFTTIGLTRIFLPNCLNLNQAGLGVNIRIGKMSTKLVPDQYPSRGISVHRLVSATSTHTSPVKSTVMELFL